MPSLHPDKLIAVRKVLHPKPKKSKRKPVPRKTYLKRKTDGMDAQEAVRTLAYKLGASNRGV